MYLSDSWVSVSAEGVVTEHNATDDMKTDAAMLARQCVAVNSCDFRTPIPCDCADRLALCRLASFPVVSKHSDCVACVTQTHDTAR